MNHNEINVNDPEIKEKFLQPNFFILIPAPVMADRGLSGDEKILYGLINSLTSKEGYCFESDKYLAHESFVTEGEIKKRIKKLEDRGHITRESKKVGFSWDRKIYTLSNNPSNRGDQGGDDE